MSDEYVCRKGADPANPNTKGAVATIFRDGISVYHLPEVGAKTHLKEPSALSRIQDGLSSIGLSTPPGPVDYNKYGGFKHSQDRLGPDGNANPLRDPLKLRDGVEGINVQFTGDKELKGCTVMSLDGRIQIDAVKDLPSKAPAAEKRAAVSFDGPGMA